MEVYFKEGDGDLCAPKPSLVRDLLTIKNKNI